VRWIGRFRFVDAEVLSGRFGVSVAAVNGRLRKLEQAGLVLLDASVPGVPRVVHVAGEGGRRIGMRVPARIRPDVQREHELTLARIVAGLELRAIEDLVVFTEREGRHRQRELGAMHSWKVLGATGRTEDRWPDLVVERAGRRTAVELELSPKPSARLERILTGFLTSQDFDGLHIYAAGEALTQRISRLANDLSWPGAPRIRVEQWGS
jgi:hypothetical protein